MAAIGIMQGRLVKPENGVIQAFPRKSWRSEFSSAAKANLDTIEWIHDDYGADVNPLLTSNGRAEMRQLMMTHGVIVRSLCADWFMNFPLVRCGEIERRLRENYLQWLLGEAAKVGITRVVIPFVDASSLRTADDRKEATVALEASIPIARSVRIELHLETDLEPIVFATFLENLPKDVIKVNFDSGNSSGLGYRPKDEFTAWGTRLGSVHIKDRVKGGGTVLLGKGSCDFTSVFAGLKALDYDGDFILQAARAIPGKEIQLARKNRAFVENHLTEAL